ncbi:spike base protein, RCAP_Rcc01079 family [Ruegeria sp. MALMAid1280]|uniref:spike base protein, RCAP_Rcc01079 family n=1 Tax=Ruegeria sp. MALMAid1280 TaxID=3411634 RepID=UPI003BA3D1F0
MTTNPFTNRVSSLSGPARDVAPVTPSDTTDLAEVAIGLYVETGGTLAMTTVRGETRTVQVADFSILPVGVTRVHASGTTASGIHALVLT